MFLTKHRQRALPALLLVTRARATGIYASFDGRAVRRQVLVFLLNGLVFVLIGLQLRAIVNELAGLSWTTLLGYAALVTAVVIVVRLVWVFPATYLPRVLSPDLRQRDPSPPWRQVVVVGWAGMRGIDSLVTAMALPFSRARGVRFPSAA